MVGALRVEDPLEVDAAADVELGRELLAALLELDVLVVTDADGAEVGGLHELLAGYGNARAGLGVAAHLGHDDGALDERLDDVALGLLDLTQGSSPVGLAVDAEKADGAAAVVGLEDYGVAEGVLRAIRQSAGLDRLDLGAVRVDELGQGLLVADDVEGRLRGHAEHGAGGGQALTVGVKDVDVHVGHGEDVVDALLGADLLDERQVVLDVGGIRGAIEDVDLHGVGHILAWVDVGADDAVPEAPQGLDGDVGCDGAERGDEYGGHGPSLRVGVNT